MARQRRIVIPGIPHHVTQRGNRRQAVFFCDEDHAAYLELLLERSLEFDVEVLAYCLMTNHVHHELVPASADGLHKLFKTVHTKYSLRVNSRKGWTGHLWQCRFFSSPLDEPHLLSAIRYVELNPVRAKMVDSPEKYQWCSARSRILGNGDPLLKPDNIWQKQLPPLNDWMNFLRAGRQNETCILRKYTRRNLPIGSADFVSNLELRSGVVLKLRPVGRPRKR